MAREKEAYRDNLEDILSFMEGKRLLNVTDVTRYLGIDRKSVLKRYPMKDGWISAPTLARELS